MIGVQESGSSRSRRLFTAVMLTAALLSVALTGCGGRSDSGTTQHSRSGTSSPTAQPQGSGRVGAGSAAVEQQAADQIEGAVNDAQSELDGLDQDFAGDDAAVAN